MNLASLPLCALAAAAGLGGGAFAGWSFGLQQRAQQEQTTARENRTTSSLVRITGGNLQETLRLQADRAAQEEKEVVAHFEKLDEALRQQLAASSAESGRANETVTRMAALLPPLKNRTEKMKGSSPAVPDTLLAEARQAIGFPGASAEWPKLTSDLTALSVKLAKPVHIKDKPSLETEVAKTTGLDALASLPAPDAWEAERKAQLEKWLQSKKP
ncbi:hypothetical protein OVA24_11530 [Luteolibacter sp. SL250]|uniref:hypothetical protein n=1 Tax=Luteolibacter sp. SL250 TaxID=2995170 RepID=UPI0022718B12|nr:hypothetical protein [Luteolibacter sp. SL250]WAC17875.1 hypothetical protein OVA24_11530 [Luteolibacter sp. SL250]